MGVEVFHHEDDLFRIGILVVDKPFTYRNGSVHVVPFRMYSLPSSTSLLIDVDEVFRFRHDVPSTKRPSIIMHLFDVPNYWELFFAFHARIRMSGILNNSIRFRISSGIPSWRNSILGAIESWKAAPLGW